VNLFSRIFFLGGRDKDKQNSNNIRVTLEEKNTGEPLNRIFPSAGVIKTNRE
jgi:hypothetical protein